MWIPILRTPTGKAWKLLFLRANNTTMAFHPSGITLDIVGINANDQGRSCEIHKCCGAVLEVDMVIRLRTIQILVNGKEETAIAAYRVSGGVDSCRVGFARRHLLNKDDYDARLEQVLEIFNDKTENPSDRMKAHRNRGCCQVVLIEAEYRLTPEKKRQKTDPPNSS